jgi:UDP-N-acetylglucosamine transferase subunit ALG13
MSQCKHVKQTEKNYMQKEHIVDNILENFIINVGSSDIQPFNAKRLVKMSRSEPFKLLNNV